MSFGPGSQWIWLSYNGTTTSPTMVSGTIPTWTYIILFPLGELLEFSQTKWISIQHMWLYIYIYYNCSNNVYNIYTYIHIRVYRYMQRHIYIYIHIIYIYSYIHIYTYTHTTMDIQICIYYRHHTHDYSQKLVQHLYVIQTLDIYLLRLACGGRFRRCATLSTSLPTTSTWRFWILG